MGLIEKYCEFFDKKYKILLYIPAILLILSLIVIGQNMVNTGSLINKDVSLKGGISITIDNPNAKYIGWDITVLESKLMETFTDGDFNVQSIGSGLSRSILISAADVEPDALRTYLESEFGAIADADYNVKIQSAQFGESFFFDTMIAILIAFIFMGVVVFIYFRSFAPSIAVIIAAFSDIVITVAILDLLGMRLSTAGVAALLMLIGYSVDTDILLSSKILKEKKSNFAKAMVEPMKTGLMMTCTTLTAVMVGLFFSISPDLIQIFTILLIGLAVDVIMTWIQNAGILRLYMEGRDE